MMEQATTLVFAAWFQPVVSHPASSHFTRIQDISSEKVHGWSCLDLRFDPAHPHMRVLKHKSRRGRRSVRTGVLGLQVGRNDPVQDPAALC